MNEPTNQQMDRTNQWTDELMDEVTTFLEMLNNFKCYVETSELY